MVKALDCKSSDFHHRRFDSDLFHLTFFNKIIFYKNVLKEVLKNNFNELLSNLTIIFSDLKMSICFLISLPFVFYIIKIQIYLGFLFLI